MSDKKCTALDHPNIQPGWGCCSCKTYNGNQRDACKACQHARCDKLNSSNEDESDLKLGWN